MCRKDHGSIRFRDFVKLLHKNGAFASEGLDDVTVVDDFVAHVDGSSELLQRHFDDLDRAVDPRTEATRSRQENLEGGPPVVGISHGVDGARMFALGSLREFLATKLPGASVDSPDNGRQG